MHTIDRRSFLSATTSILIPLLVGCSGDGSSGGSPAPGAPQTQEEYMKQQQAQQKANKAAPKPKGGRKANG